MSRDSSNATLVCASIWIGDATASASETFFKKYDVKGVLNCTPALPDHFRGDPDIEYMRIPVHDSLSRRDIKQLFDYFPVICEFIHKIVVIKKQTLLIHCRLARQRSAASVAAYLIKNHGLNPNEAMTYLLKKKPDVFCFGRSVNFAAALNKWYHKINNEGKAP